MCSLYDEMWLAYLFQMNWEYFRQNQVLRKLDLCTILSENHQEGEQIIFMDIRVLLNANNHTETYFADEPLFWRKLG